MTDLRDRVDDAWPVEELDCPETDDTDCLGPADHDADGNIRFDGWLRSVGILG